MDVYITALGCRLNEAESHAWARELEGGGDRLVATAEDADVAIINTCAVTAEAARKSRKLISGIHRRSPKAKLVVTGCYSELDSDGAKALDGVDLVVANTDKEDLLDIVRKRLDFESMPRAALGESTHHVFEGIRTRAFVKAQDGCRNRCTFCIVTIARGKERSRSIDEIVAEISDLVGRGYREVVITGVHLGGYGSDLGTDLRQLVEAILARTEVARLRLSSLEPWDLPEEFWRLWDDPRLMPHLHLPLQSGSDGVLRRMARRCSTLEYRELAGLLREHIGGLVLTTDIIVGFPGETDEEWEETMAFVREIGFAHLHIFAFSPRQGTTAARMGGQVPGAIKRARSRALHEIAAEMKVDHHRRVVGEIRPVLWEGEGEVVAGGLRRYRGYTDNYLRVSTFVPDRADSLENRVLPTRLSVDGDGELVGEISIGVGGRDAQ